MVVASSIEKCTRSGRPLFISFSIPFIAAKCQELSSKISYECFPSFFACEITDGWCCNA